MMMLEEQSFLGKRRWENEDAGEHHAKMRVLSPDEVGIFQYLILGGDEPEDVTKMRGLNPDDRSSTLDVMDGGEPEKDDDNASIVLEDEDETSVFEDLLEKPEAKGTVELRVSSKPVVGLQGMKPPIAMAPAPRGNEGPPSNAVAEEETEECTIYVRICRLFQRNPGEDLTTAFILRVMATEFPHWHTELTSCDDQHRQAFLLRMCTYREKQDGTFIRLLFWLLRVVSFFEQSEEGRCMWNARQEGFHQRFEGTIARVLADRVTHAETFRRNPMLDSHVKDSFVVVEYVLRYLPLHRNLCFLLMVVSCIEGRGVYHGRTSNGLSLPHMCYRYLIESLGGVDVSAIPVAKRKRAVKTIVELFHPTA
jgi:hypothetical protein